MLKKLLFAVFILSQMLSPLFNQRVTAASGCSICILEIGTGTVGDEEADFVVIGNVTLASQSLSSVQLQYHNSLGVYDSKYSMSGTLLPGQLKLFVSSSLKSFNPTASTLPFSIYSGGGALKIVKVLTSSTTVYDLVGWGNSSLKEATSISFTDPNYHFVRSKTSFGTIVDTDNNGQDFVQSSSDCDSILINEIQPFSTDESGKAVESWVELSYNNDVTDNCAIVGDDGLYYFLPIVNNPDPDALIAVGGVNNDEEAIFLQLPNPTGSLATAYVSEYSTDQPVFIPLSIATYSNLEKSQSYGLFNEYGSYVWRATYQPTPGEINQFLASPPVIISGDSNACENIRINEIYPNPTGSDTSQEWVEVYNLSSDPGKLDQCVLSIESELYYFLKDSSIGPNQYMMIDSMFSEEGNPKSISLRNSEETFVSMSRLYAGNLDLIQSLIYSDAPESMTYSRFEEGWAWSYAPTPDAVNQLLSSKPLPLVTESKAVFSNNTLMSIENSSQIKAPASTSKKTASKSTSSSSKSLASTAKSTIGAKSTDTRDVYDAPDEFKREDDKSYVFVVIGLMAVIYALYEYKVDLQNFYYRWRRNKELGVENWPTN